LFVGGRPYSPRTRLVLGAPPRPPEAAPPGNARLRAPEGLVLLGEGGASSDGRTARAHVFGDALRSAGIRDGDEVLLVRRARAEHGDLGAFGPDGASESATLWRVRHGGDGVRGVNDARSVSLGAEAQLLGVVVAVRRRFSGPGR
jgi:hypothetical protein